MGNEEMAAAVPIKCLGDLVCAKPVGIGLDDSRRSCGRNDGGKLVVVPAKVLEFDRELTASSAIDRQFWPTGIHYAAVHIHPRFPEVRLLI